MLEHLAIRNFALIDHLELTLDPGFTILTGETGAGKSIIIDAVTGLLGARLGPEWVRSEADQARLEGFFRLPAGPAGQTLRALLAEHGLAEDDETLILSREVHRSGRTVARINGRAVPVSLLQQVGRFLVDIHGQTENLSLLRTSQHLEFLDAFAGLLPARAALAAQVARLRTLQRELQALEQDERAVAQRIDLLRFQLEEIRAAALQPDEEERLRQERTRLANAEKLQALAEAAYALLYGGQRATPAAFDLLGQAQTHLQELARLEPTLAPLVERLTIALDAVEEAARAVRAYRESLDLDPARLEAVDERLYLISTLKRKYGASVPEILAYAEQAARELETLLHREERGEELRTAIARLREEIGRQAAALSTARAAAARQLEAAVEGELRALHMGQARFAVALQQTPAPDGLPWPDGRRLAFDATGADRVEFLISPNPGEPLKPLTRIASGGEMARLMLALKSILATVDPVPVLIFDEVDTGVGGRSGHVIGQKLAGLAATHQVLCVTHLPQVAAYGDVHYLVSKEVVGGRTVTRVRRLDPEERLSELSAMLAGPQAGAAARASARELLGQAAAWKARHRPPPAATAPVRTGG